jgi:hypothetical protein
MGHKLAGVPTVAGGMNAIEFNDDGQLRALHVGAPTARRSASPVDWHAPGFDLAWSDNECD